MSDYTITGKIYFENNCQSTENIKKYLENKAIDNQIWIRIKQFPNKSLLYEIVDNSSPNSECKRIFENISYGCKGFRIVDVSCSGLPSVEKFLIDVVSNPLISYIDLDIDLSREYPRIKYHRTICAGQFCRAIIDAPNGGNEVPLLKLTINKC